MLWGDTRPAIHYWITAAKVEALVQREKWRAQRHGKKSLLASVVSEPNHELDSGGARSGLIDAAVWVSAIREITLEMVWESSLSSQSWVQNLVQSTVHNTQLSRETVVNEAQRSVGRVALWHGQMGIALFRAFANKITHVILEHRAADESSHSWIENRLLQAAQRVAAGRGKGTEGPSDVWHLITSPPWEIAALAAITAATIPKQMLRAYLGGSWLLVWQVAGLVVSTPALPLLLLGSFLPRAAGTKAASPMTYLRSSL